MISLISIYLHVLEDDGRVPLNIFFMVTTVIMHQFTTKAIKSIQELALYTYTATKIHLSQI